MRQIPLSAVPAQTCSVVLNGHNCQLRVWQKFNGLYLDLFKNHAPIAQGVLCRDRVWIVRNTCLGFEGDLVFEDTQGADDPHYTGINGRFRLLYQEDAPPSAGGKS